MSGHEAVTLFEEHPAEFALNCELLRNGQNYSAVLFNYLGAQLHNIL